MIVEWRRAKKDKGAKRLSEQARAHNRKMDALQWVATARSTDETRAVLLNVFAPDEKTLVATDGYRLHCATVEHGLDVGMYRVLKAAPAVWLDRVGDGESYPKYGAVIPDDESTATTFYHAGPSGYLFALAVAIHKHCGAILDIDFLDQAIPSVARGEELTLRCTDDVSAVRINHSLGVAVVMPVRKW